jgi:hypothetical protein
MSATRLAPAGCPEQLQERRYGLTGRGRLHVALQRLEAAEVNLPDALAHRLADVVNTIAAECGQRPQARPCPLVGRISS